MAVALCFVTPKFLIMYKQMNQPAPIHTDGDSMHDLVMDKITHDPRLSTATKLRLIEAFTERKAIGAHRYGTILQAHNGRDFGQDAFEEITDFCVYWRGEIEEQGANDLNYQIYEDALLLASSVSKYLSDKANKEKIQKVKDSLKSLSKEEMDRRKPTVPPDILANALQDTIYVSTGKSRPAKCKRASKNKEEK